MTTPQREAKHIHRQLRTIPVDAIAPAVLAEERDGMWCIVGSELTFVFAKAFTSETTWDDALMLAQFVRYVRSQPERVHSTLESARAFVRSRLTNSGGNP